jgi:mRNA-degrading endonuclease toxin of MazEF toxin-antitoxin module
MVDKVVSVPRSAIGKSVGRCLPQELDAVDEALRTWLAL